ncbi:MAG: hypothetical protein OER82_00255, partial [Nitrosopumilus sp.]|nr:hypothetical protein [Nitrosopumilus sp.]
MNEDNTRSREIILEKLYGTDNPYTVIQQYLPRSRRGSNHKTMKVLKTTFCLLTPSEAKHVEKVLNTSQGSVAKRFGFLLPNYRRTLWAILDSKLAIGATLPVCSKILSDILKIGKSLKQIERQDELAKKRDAARKKEAVRRRKEAKRRKLIRENEEYIRWSNERQRRKVVLRGLHETFSPGAAVARIANEQRKRQRILDRARTTNRPTIIGSLLPSYLRPYKRKVHVVTNSSMTNLELHRERFTIDARYTRAVGLRNAVVGGLLPVGVFLLVTLLAPLAYVTVAYGGPVAARFVAGELSLVGFGLKRIGQSGLVYALSNPLLVTEIGLFSAGLIMEVEGDLPALLNQIKNDPIQLAQLFAEVLIIKFTAKTPSGLESEVTTKSRLVKGQKPNKKSFKLETFDADANETTPVKQKQSTSNQNRGAQSNRQTSRGEINTDSIPSIPTGLRWKSPKSKGMRNVPEKDRILDLPGTHGQLTGIGSNSPSGSLSYDSGHLIPAMLTEPNRPLAGVSPRSLPAIPMESKFNQAWKSYETQFWSRRIPGTNKRIFFQITPKLAREWVKKLHAVGIPRESLDQVISTFER